MAVEFPGTEGVFLKTDESPIVSATPFTFACWYRPTVFGVQHAIMSVNDSSASNVAFQVYTSALDPQAIRVRARAGTPPGTGVAETVNTISPLLPPQPWNHICAVFTSDTLRAIYLDADTANKGTDTDNVVPGNLDRMALGAFYDSTPSNELEGDLAEATFWDVALTEADIVALATGCSPEFIRPESIVAYYDLIRQRKPRRGEYVLDSDVFWPDDDTDHPPIVYPAGPPPVVPSISPLLHMMHYYRQRRTA
jgi:hypothetical protein